MPFDTVDSDLTVIPVATRAELKRFVQLPNRLNAKDPSWVIPLEMERMAALTPKTNPFFQHADVQMWLAVRGGRDVAGSAPRSTTWRPRPRARRPAISA